MTRDKAIRKTHPTVAVINGETQAWDSEGNEVTLNEELISAEMERLQAEYNSNEYKRKRKEEYPDFIEYLDGIVKNDTEQIQAYITACQAVKAKYPKP
jgi:hypothetical protein